jgi:zinc transport system substrate-binding protein
VHRSCALPAAGAQADDFNGLAFDTETDRSGTGDYGLADHRLLQLDGRVALAADQELALVGKLRLIAADEGVERGNAVDQAVFQEKIQRTVDRRRRRATTVFFAQHGEDVIGAQRLVALPDQLQHPFAQGGQAQTLARTDALRFGQGVTDAAGMVMWTRGQGCEDHGRRRLSKETLLYYLFFTVRVSLVLRLFSAASLLCVAQFFSLGATAEVRVLTSIKPLQLIAAAVQDGVGTPAVLLPPGASPHHYALRPSDVRRVREVDLVYWIGADLESFLPRVLASRDKPSVAMQSLAGLSLRHFGEEHDEHAGAHEEDSHQPDQSFDEHDHDHRPGTLDAHLWLLPANARVIAARMAADLASADPANAVRYQANLAAFAERLTALDQRLKSRLAALAGKPYFVFHEAYDYFEAAYGLKHAGVFSVASEVQPGARHVAAMRASLQAAGPTCVFSEPPLRPRLAQTLTAGLPVTLAELDAMGAGLPVDARGYEALLENLATVLAGCLEAL